MDLPSRMQADLLVARKARDATRVTVLRTTLAAFSNAEAPPVPETSSFASPVGGLAEHDRLVLTVEDHQRILQEQINARDDAAAEYDQLSQTEAAATLRAELVALRPYLT